VDARALPGENPATSREVEVDRRVVVVGAALLLIAVVGVGGWAAMNRQVPTPAAPEVRVGKEPGPSIDRPPEAREQVVVRYADGVTDERISSFEAQHGLRLAKEIPAVHARVYDVPAGHGTKEVIGWFTGEPGLVEYAERNGRMEAK
jgi:hypothetical protein